MRMVQFIAPMIGLIGCNNVLLVKIERSVWYTIYHQFPIEPIAKGVKQTPPLINQPLGKGHL